MLCIAVVKQTVQQPGQSSKQFLHCPQRTESTLRRSSQWTWLWTRHERRSSSWTTFSIKTLASLLMIMLLMLVSKTMFHTVAKYISCMCDSIHSQQWSLKCSGDSLPRWAFESLHSQSKKGDFIRWAFSEAKVDRRHFRLPVAPATRTQIMTSDTALYHIMLALVPVVCPSVHWRTKPRQGQVWRETRKEKQHSRRCVITLLPFVLQLKEENNRAVNAPL
jgi:hypothetical protein